MATLHRFRKASFTVLGILLTACAGPATGEPARVQAGQGSVELVAAPPAESVKEVAASPAAQRGGEAVAADTDEEGVAFTSPAAEDAPVDASAWPTAPANVEPQEGNVEAATSADDPQGAAPHAAGAQDAEQGNVSKNPDAQNRVQNQSQPQPGAAAGPGQSGAIAPRAENAAELDVSGWPVYTDAEYGFRVQHPPTFVAEQSTEGVPVRGGPAAVYAVTFKNTQEGLAAVAPVFSVQVLELSTGQALEDYLEGNNLTGAQANVEARPYSGNGFNGIEALSLNYMSPGRFIYAVQGANVFRLTPVGEIGDAMLATFMLQ